MTSIDNLMERCASVVAKWAERAPSVETIQDFADVFDLEVRMVLEPRAFPEDRPLKNPVTKPEQGEFSFELSEDDQFAIQGWRESNGL